VGWLVPVCSWWVNERAPSNEAGSNMAWAVQWVQLAGLLLDFAGAWWVGWCLSQLSLLQSVEAAVHHTRDGQRVTRPGFLCTKKSYPGIFRRF
jgi:hypothetical protein